MCSVKEKQLFEDIPVGKAVFRLAFPTVIGQIILVIYNMADTFFAGLAHNDSVLAAITICMPAFMFLSAISNLFGIGGASVISRALGKGDGKEARRASAFAFYGCLLVTVFYCLAVWLFLDPFLDLLGGTHPDIHRNAADYLFWAVAVGGVFTATGMFFSHLLRSEGHAVYAGAGVVLGGLLNLVLDPLFMFVLLPPGREALGAAAATALSNLISLFYFTEVLRKLRGNLHVSFRFSADACRGSIPRAIFCAGLPACIMTLFENISYAVLDKLMSLEGIPMQAGIGVAKKVNMLSHCIVRGITQGVLPLIGFNYSAGGIGRMRAAVRAARTAAVGTALLCMAVNLAFAPRLIGLFIHEKSLSLTYGAAFLRILSVGAPLSASAYIVISFFQATGEGARSFLLAVLRKGIVDIPLMFILQSLIPVYGIVLATPVADVVCCLTAHILFTAFFLRNFPAQAGQCLRKAA